MSSPAVRVLIAEDQALVSAGFRVVLENEDGITVVAQTGGSEDVVDVARRVRPDVVLMDLDSTGSDAVEATHRLVADPATGDARVLMLSDLATDEQVLAALRAGAAGVLHKNADATGLVRAVRTVADGQPLLSPRLARRLLDRLAQLPQAGVDAAESLSELTDREREVVALVARGLTNDQIAERLVVSRATAKTHVSRTMVKLRVRDRAQLVVLAYESGLVLPPET